MCRSSQSTSSSKLSLLAGAAAAVLALSSAGVARASESATPFMAPAPGSSAADIAPWDAPSAAARPQHPLFFDDAAPPAPTPPPPEQPNIHGFVSFPFKTAYVTPRGLAVENQGLVMQPVAGLVLPIGDLGPLKGFTLVTGVWNSINTNQGDTDVGPWNEMDFFFSMSGAVANIVSLNLTYGAWNFPNSTAAKPSTEHNIDLKISIDDSAMWGKNFSINPYADIFYEVGGSSTVTLGKNGNTGYLELGVAPTVTLKASPDYPLTISVPTYVSMGPKEYWGRGGTGLGVSAKPDGNFGLASISGNLSVPLAFIPARYGHWHGDLGVTYDYLLNSTLLRAGTALCGNNNRNVLIGSVGIGVNF